MAVASADGGLVRCAESGGFETSEEHFRQWRAVVAEGVEDIFKLAGLGRPDIGILSDAFLEEVRNLPQHNFAVELLQKLLNDEIKSRSRTNVILERKFSDRLLAALNRYRSRPSKARRSSKS